MDLDQIQQLDDLSMRAVPPEQVHEIDGWSVRRTPGIATRRVNSVLARRDGVGSLQARLEEVERFYGEAGLDARFQLTPAARPAGLREMLLKHGYHADEPTSVQACALSGQAGAITGDILVQVSPHPTSQWWTTWRAGRAAAPGQTVAVQRLFERIDLPCAYVTISAPGQSLAIGTAVLDGEWVGIYNMATLAAHRRRGAGSAALAALMSWAGRSGARLAYLQVSVDNDAAMALYARAGFRELYRYEYLTKPLAAG